MKFKLLSFHTNVHNSFHIFNGLAVPKTPLSLPAPFTNTVDSVCNELLFVSWGYVTCFTRPFSSLLPWTSIVRYSILCVWICSYFSNTCVMPLHTNYRHARLFLHSVYITLLSRDNIWSVSSVQSLSCVRLFATTWIAARQASLSITNSWSLLKLTSIESVMPSNHLILCCPLLLPPSIFPSIRVFSNESVFHIRWPKEWSFSFSISLSNEGLPMVSSRFEIKSSSGGTRCHHDKTVLEEKRKKVCCLQFYFLLLLPRLLTLSFLCIKGFSHLSTNYKKQNRNKVWRLYVCMCIVWNKVHCH